MIDPDYDLNVLHDVPAAIRGIEERIARDYAKQEMRCPVHLSLGAEEPAAAVCAHLTRDDLVLAHHRCHAAYLAKGGSVEKMLNELHGKESGCTQGRGGSMHLSDLDAGFVAAIPVVGAVLPIAAGVALSLKGTGNICVAFVGDGATETGVFWETMNLAWVRGAPLLVVIEDNNRSVDTPATERRGKWLWHAFDGFSENVEKSVSEARQNTPGVLRFYCTRRVEHCGPRIVDG